MAVHSISDEILFICKCLFTDDVGIVMRCMKLMSLCSCLGSVA